MFSEDKYYFDGIWLQGGCCELVLRMGLRMKKI